MTNLLHAAPVDMLQEGSYTIEYVQFVHYQGPNQHDNWNASVIFDNSLVDIVKLKEDSRYFFLDLGLYRDVDEFDEIIANTLEVISPDSNIVVTMKPEHQSNQGKILNAEFYINNIHLFLENPHYAWCVQWSLYYDSEVLDTFPVKVSSN